VNAVPASSTAGWRLIAISAVIVPAAGSLALLAIAMRPGVAPFLLLACAVTIVAVRRPWLILPGFIALAWMSIPQGIYGGLPSPVEICGVALLGLAIWRAWRTPEPAFAPLTIVLLIALAEVATGLVATGGPALPLHTLSSLSFLLIVALMVRGEDDPERVAIALCIAGTVLGLGAAYSVLVHPTALFPLNVETGGEAARAAGPFGESNFFALSLAALVPFSVHLISRGPPFRLLGAVSACSLVAGVLATGSRGALIAIAFALIAFVIFSKDKRARLAVVIALVAAVAVAPAFSAQTSSSANRTISGRATENRISVAMFLDHPVSGVGPGGYPPLYRDYARRIGNDSRILREPHSLPLQIAAEEGVVGLLAWFAAGAVVVGYARKKRLWQVPVGRATILALTTYLVGSLFLHGSQLNLLFILAGLLFALGSVRPESALQQNGRPYRRPAIPEPA
jgi:putative inorganic carbon (hco3(-)) transporter